MASINNLDSLNNQFNKLSKVINKSKLNRNEQSLNQSLELNQSSLELNKKASKKRLEKIQDQLRLQRDIVVKSTDPIKYSDNHSRRIESCGDSDSSNLHFSAEVSHFLESEKENVLIPVMISFEEPIGDNQYLHTSHSADTLETIYNETSKERILRKRTFSPIDINFYSNDDENVVAKDIKIPMFVCSLKSRKLCKDPKCVGFHDVFRTVNQYGRLPENKLRCKNYTNCSFGNCTKVHDWNSINEVNRFINAHENSTFKIYKDDYIVNVNLLSDNIKNELMINNKVTINDTTYEKHIFKYMNIPYSIIDKLNLLKLYIQNDEKLSRCVLETDKANNSNKELNNSDRSSKKSRTCSSKNCGQCSIINFPFENSALYCSDHAKDIFRHIEYKHLFRNEYYKNRDTSELFNKFKYLKGMMIKLNKMDEWNYILIKLNFTNNEVILIENILKRMNLCFNFKKGQCSYSNCNYEHNESNLICYASLDNLCNTHCSKVHINFIKDLYKDDLNKNKISLIEIENKVEDITLNNECNLSFPNLQISPRKNPIVFPNSLIHFDNMDYIKLYYSPKSSKLILNAFDYKKITSPNDYDNLISIYNITSDEGKIMFKLVNKDEINIPDGITESCNYYKTQICNWNDIIKKNGKNVTIIDEYTFSILVRSNDNIEWYNRSLQSMFVIKKKNSGFDTCTWIVEWAKPSVQDEFDNVSWEEYNNMNVYDDNNRKILIVNYISYVKFKTYTSNHIFSLYEDYCKNNKNKAFKTFMKKWDKVQSKWISFTDYNKYKNNGIDIDNMNENNTAMDYYYNITDYFYKKSIHKSDSPFRDNILLKEIALNNQNIYNKYKTEFIQGNRISFLDWIQNDPKLAKTMEIYQENPQLQFTSIYSYVAKINRSDIPLDLYIKYPNKVKSWIHKREFYGICIPDIKTYILEEENINNWISSRSILNNISYESFSLEHFEATTTKCPVDLTFFNFEDLIVKIDIIKSHYKYKFGINDFKITFYKYEELIEEILKNEELLKHIISFNDENNFTIKSKIKIIVESSVVTYENLLNHLEEINNKFLSQSDCYDLIIKNKVEKIYQSSNDHDIITILNLINENKNNKSQDNVDIIKKVLNNINTKILFNRESKLITSINNYIKTIEVDSKKSKPNGESYKNRLLQKSEKSNNSLNIIESVVVKDKPKEHIIMQNDIVKDQLDQINNLQEREYNNYNIFIEKFENKFIIVFKNINEKEKFKDIKKSFCSSSYIDSKIEHSKIGDNIKYIFKLAKEYIANAFVVNTKKRGGKDKNKISNRMKTKNDSFAQDLIYLLKRIAGGNKIENTPYVNNDSDSDETYMPMNGFKLSRNRFDDLDESSDSDISESDSDSDTDSDSESDDDINVIHMEKDKDIITNIYSKTLNIK